MKSIDWTKWSAIAEILSAAAIVVTLVYLSLQTRYLAQQTEQNNLLLEQGQAISQATRIQIASDGLRNWTALIADNAEVWAKGIAAEPLSVEESIVFRAMAEAREADLNAFWQSAVLTGRPEEVANSILLQIAEEFTAYPGLLEFWREHAQRMRNLERPGDYLDLVEAEMARMQGEAQDSE